MSETRASRWGRHRWHRQRVEVTAHADVNGKLLNEVPMVVERSQHEVHLRFAILLVELLALLSRKPELLEGESLLLLVIGKPLGEGRDLDPSRRASN